MPDTHEIAEPRPLWPDVPVDSMTVDAADHLLDHLLATDPDSHPDDPGEAIDAAEVAQIRHRFAMNRYGATQLWEDLTAEQRGAATIEAWTWLRAARSIGLTR